MPTAQRASNATLGDYKRRLLRVLEYIQQHLDDHLDLEELARVACFSTYHFHRIFTGMMGETIKNHIRRLRLERAAIELRVGTKPIVEVALDSGYEAHEAFSRAFKSAYGVAPVRFRSTKSPIAALVAPSGVHYCPGAALTTFNTNHIGIPTMNVRIKPSNRCVWPSCATSDRTTKSVKPGKMSSLNFRKTGASEPTQCSSAFPTMTRM